MRHRVLLLCLALVFVLAWTWHATHDHADDAPDAAREARPAGDPTLVVATRDDPHAPAPSEPEGPAEIVSRPIDRGGPDVYTTPLPEALPAIDPVVTIRVRHAMGTVPRAHAGTARDSVGHWMLASREDTESADAAGSVATDGLIRLGAAHVKAWRHATLHISLDGHEVLSVARPRDPLPKEIVVQAVPEDDLVPVQFTGTVYDACGKGVSGAGVFVVEPGAADPGALEPAARTEADGAFRLAAALPPAGARRLVVVAHGFADREIDVRAGGEDGVDVRLTRADRTGSLSLTLVAPDGTPAAWARVLMQPEGEPLIDADGFPRGATEAGTPRPRQLRLARLLGGHMLSAQGYQIGTDAYLHDLLADGAGHLLVPTLAPGRYRLRAALPARAKALIHDTTTYGEVRLKAGFDATVEIKPPPEVTRIQLRFPAGRSVHGRIVVDQRAPRRCTCTKHQHFVRPRGWPWAGVQAQSSVQGRRERSGVFRLDGMPPGPLQLVVWTHRHGEIQVEVPAGAPGQPTHLGVLRVPAASD